MTKILTWIKVNLASVLGMIQASIKAVKEVLTAVINLISIFIPAIAAQKIVLKIRGMLETLDGWIEKIKPYLVLVV